MNLVELLQDQAEDSTALIDRGNSIPFGELDSDTASAASDLRRRNFDPGDTILFFHPVSIRLYVALLAVMRAGLTAVFIDPSASPDFIARCVNLVKPRAFFGSWKARLFLPLKIPVLRDIPKISNFEANAAPDSSEIFPAEGHEPALITFTSGSTGEPKGVARSHEFLLAQHASLSRSLRLEAGQVDLVTLPVFVLANLASGTTSILADTNLARPGVVKAKRVARQIGAGAVTRIVASPAFFESLTKRKKKAVFPGVREVFTGGAPVFPRTLRRLKSAFPNARITAVYGSTEAEPIAEIALDQISETDFEKMKSGGGLLAGTPVPEIELEIADDGEIVVTGPHVLKGYLDGKGDAETKFTGADGETIWHRTGDLGRLDTDGRLWLLGRVSAKIGDELCPFAVECALSFVEGVGRTAVLESEEDGQPVLFLEGNGEVGPILNQFGIHRIIPLKKIPVDRRHNAKVDYPALRKILANFE